MRIEKNPELAWREVGGETIVIHLGRKMMYGLNPAGGRLWAAIGDGAALEELESSFLAEAGVEAQLRGAIRVFLAELEAEDLVAADGPLVVDQGPDAEVPAGPLTPRIAWREEVRRFAGACAKFPGVSQICDQFPQNS